MIDSSTKKMFTKITAENKSVKVKPYGFLPQSPHLVSLRVVFCQKTLTALTLHFISLFIAVIGCLHFLFPFLLFREELAFAGFDHV